MKTTENPFLLTCLPLLLGRQLEVPNDLRLLGREGHLLRAGAAGRGLPVGAEAAGADIGLGAGAADEGALVGVEPLVQLQVHELGELRAADVAGVRLEPRM